MSRQNHPQKLASETTHFWKEHLIPGLLLFVIPFMLYGYSTTFGYVLDDKIVITDNKFVKEGFAGIWDILTTESFTGFLGKQQDLVVGARYRPLSLVTFAIEYQFLGLNPAVGHFLNILLYALTGILIYRLFHLYPGTRKKPKWYLALPFVGALVFILHPVHSEVVANIKGRDEILALLLSLTTLYVSLMANQRENRVGYIASGVLFFVSLLAKENSLTFLAVIPMTIYFSTKDSFRKVALSAVPLLIASALYLLLRYNVIGYLLDSGKEVTGLMNNPFVGTSIGERFATIFYTLLLYIKLLFVPHPLTHDYYPYQIPILNWMDLRAITSLLVYGILTVFAVYSLKKKKIPAYSILFYIATLSIVSNLVFPIGTFMNERFLYMPSVGFAMLVAYWICWKIPEWISKTSLVSGLQIGFVLLITLGFSVKTISRVPAWKDGMSLNRAAAKVSTGSARANSFMAYALYEQSLTLKDNAEKKKLYDEALPYVTKALKIYPTYTDALTVKAGLAAGYYQQDRDLDKLLKVFEEVVKAKPVAFVNQYCEYLNKRNPDTVKMLTFYFEVGYTYYWLEKKNRVYAENFLKYAEQLDPTNQSIQQALQQVRNQ